MIEKQIVVIAALALAPRAYADSCDARVADVMAQHAMYVTYCAECGDGAPSVPLAWMPGQQLDAAHAYVQTSPTRYELVSALADCAFAAGPIALRVIDETPTGVLIVPDAVPVARAEPAPPPMPAAPAPVIVQVDDTLPDWLVGMLGGLAGSLVTLAWCVPRRRRANLPRAIDLAGDEPRVRIDRWVG